MKALTISQPWADLIARVEKWVENRNWSTPYRGPLAIHAGSGTHYLTRQQLQQYTTGAIVATAELVACVDVGRPTDQDRQELARVGLDLEQLFLHTYCEGPFAWVLQDIRPAAEPYFIPGRQGLWEFDLAAAVESLAF